MIHNLERNSAPVGERVSNVATCYSSVVVIPGYFLVMYCQKIMRRYQNILYLYNTYARGTDYICQRLLRHRPTTVKLNLQEEELILKYYRMSTYKS